MADLFPVGSYSYFGFYSYNSSYAYNFFGTSVDDRKNSALGLGGEALIQDVGFFPEAFRSIREGEVQHPSDMIAAGDGWLQRIPGPTGTKIYSDPVLDRPVYYGPQMQTTVLSVLQLLHNARFNVLFCDGHVERTRVELLYSWGDDRLSRWNNDRHPHRETLN